MPRTLRMVEREDGWCDWIHPLKGYRMICCDCGLSHEMQFKVIQHKGRNRIIFRAKRHKRSTAQVRRHIKQPGDGK